MNGTAIDHVKLLIPEGDVETAIAFYRDALGFGIEGMDLYEADEKPFFSVRLAPGAVIHLQPTETGERPGADRSGYDHVAVRVDDTIEGIESALDDAGVEIDRRLDPLGATGVAPAVYVTDPFGYRLELKAERE
ncbi:VOC family protein [Halobellus limi]|uniref:Lactoylglutathione lyase n=1 Tax=Halobellus limi TaxID=699433 RepID=A0A1H5W149_9EURY|nr:VOC family protein [Halobellus limi]QCC46564.1 VOC family protein [Halobellus limi]SEF93008.1 lactoylglutathione lyase [Halobellus limi]